MDEQSFTKSSEKKTKGITPAPNCCVTHQSINRSDLKNKNKDKKEDGKYHYSNLRKSIFSEFQGALPILQGK